MRASHVVLLALCANGCSDSSNQKVDAGNSDGGIDALYDFDEGAKSGTRLKLRYYDFGTVRELTGIRDTQRAEDCTPTDWANGNTYCMPTDVAAVVYTDDNCTQGVAMAYVEPCSAPAPEYYIQYSRATCGSAATKLYRRGAAITRNGHYYLSGDTCYFNGASPSYAYYALGAEVAVADLATLTLSAPSTPGRLGARYRESVDGLRYPLQHQLEDSELGSCTPYATAGGIGRCQPRVVAYGGSFGDAACTQVIGTETTGCPVRTAIVTFGACAGDVPRYYAVGAKLTPTTVYADNGGTCTATPASTGVDYFAAGAELTPATVTREIKTGPERLQPIYYATAEGLRTRDYGLFDTQLGTACNPAAQPDGTIQCVPSSSSWQTMYRDAGCTIPVDLTRVFQQPTCAAHVAPLYSVKRTPSPSVTCGFDYLVRRVGPAYTDLAYLGSPGSCSPYNPNNIVLYPVLDAVAPGDLASGTLVVE